MGVEIADSPEQTVSVVMYGMLTIDPDLFDEIGVSVSESDGKEITVRVPYEVATVMATDIDTVEKRVQEHVGDDVSVSVVMDA